MITADDSVLRAHSQNLYGERENGESEIIVLLSAVYLSLRYKLPSSSISMRKNQIELARNHLLPNFQLLLVSTSGVPAMKRH